MTARSSIESSDVMRVPVRIRWALAAIGVMLALIIPTAAHAATTLCASPNYGYNCVASTGYHGQPTWGYPVDARGHGSTNYAAHRLAQNGMPNPGSFGDAKDWAKNARSAGYRVDATPTVGSIAQWNTTPQSADGHVAVVEVVTPSYVETTEDSDGGTTSRKRYVRGESDWPHNFIHIKDAVPAETSSPQSVDSLDGEGKAEINTIFGGWWLWLAGGFGLLVGACLLIRYRTGSA